MRKTARLAITRRWGELWDLGARKMIVTVSKRLDNYTAVVEVRMRDGKAGKKLACVSDCQIATSDGFRRGVMSDLILEPLRFQTSRTDQISLVVCQLAWELGKVFCWSCRRRVPAISWKSHFAEHRKNGTAKMGAAFLRSLASLDKEEHNSPPPQRSAPKVR